MGDGTRRLSDHQRDHKLKRSYKLKKTFLNPRTTLGTTALAVVAALTLAIVVTIGARPTAVSAQTPSNDATLSALTASPKDIIGFAANRASYEVGVASTVTQATVSATANDSAASVAISPADADTGTAGHQVTLSAGRNAVTISVTAEDGNTTRDYTVNVNRGVDIAYGWKAEDDLDGLIEAGNVRPLGVWSDGTTLWVADDHHADYKIYAYNLSTGARDSNKDFDTLRAASNGRPTGIWSNGTTMWVADRFDDKIYAYNLSTKQRDAAKDFGTLNSAGNNNAVGLWSDGTTMWAADRVDDKIYAYNLSTKQRDEDKDFGSLDDAGNHEASDIWSDGATMWVADTEDDKIYAYNLSTKQRDEDKDFDTLSAAGNVTPAGLWSDGTTMWVAEWTNRKVYSYNMVSDDATLSALAVSPRDIAGFAADRDWYEVGVASTVTQATVSATANDSAASVGITPLDADTGTTGHQVDLSAGRNAVMITVTAEDGNTTRYYTVNVNRGVDIAYGWKAADDLDGLIEAGNVRPTGVWSDGTTIWVADYSGNKIYAYNLSTKDRDRSKDFDTLSGADNRNPWGIWSDGTTMWVADDGDKKIYAYNLATKDRDRSKDFDTLSGADNDSPTGVWSDGTTMWVADLLDNKIYAYNLATKDRDRSKDFDTLSGADNDSPTGIWSNGATMWVADYSGNKIYAYNLSTKDRDDTRDFDTILAAGNVQPNGIWSDGTTMWVARFPDKVFSYNMPAASDDATLSALAVSPRDIVGFTADRVSYEVGVASTITRATVSATANDGAASVEIDPADADTGTAGHQVDLSAGRNAVTVTVTAENGTTQDYTINVNPAAADRYGWKAVDDLDGLTAAGNGAATGVWSDGTTMWVADDTGSNLYAYNLSDGSREVASDFNTLDDAGNQDPRDIWSNGTTMWVADDTGNNLYAYHLATKERDDVKDFDTLSGADNVDPWGVWSDGATMWVTDTDDGQIYAYNLATGERDENEDFNTLGTEGNDEPRGIWSNGTTMWVVDSDDDKIYAYNLLTKNRDSAKEFNTLSAAGNNDPTGIWSDGRTMWVADLSDGKVYSYHLADPNAVPPTPPGAVNLEVEPRHSELFANWDPPRDVIDEDSNVVPVLSYLVRYRSGSSWITVSRDNDDTSTEQTITGLSNGTTYTVQVAAVNRIGAGEWASTTGTPENQNEPPVSGPEDSPQFDVGFLFGWWTQGPNTEMLHEDVRGSSNFITGNPCQGTYHFRVIWDGPREEGSNGTFPAADWDVYIQSNDNLGDFEYSFYERPEHDKATVMAASIDLTEPTIMSVKIRGRFGTSEWGNWSKPTSMACSDREF